MHATYKYTLTFRFIVSSSLFVTVVLYFFFLDLPTSFHEVGAASAAVSLISLFIINNDPWEI